MQDSHNIERERLQDIIRQVIVLNTDVGEASKEFERRFGKLKKDIADLYEAVDDKIEEI